MLSRIPDRFVAVSIVQHVLASIAIISEVHSTGIRDFIRAATFGNRSGLRAVAAVPGNSTVMGWPKARKETTMGTVGVPGNRSLKLDFERRCWAFAAEHPRP